MPSQFMKSMIPLSALSAVLFIVAGVTSSAKASDFQTMRRNCQLVVSTSDEKLKLAVDELIKQSSEIVIHRDTPAETYGATIAFMKKTCRKTLRLSHAQWQAANDYNTKVENQGQKQIRKNRLACERFLRSSSDERSQVAELLGLSVSALKASCSQVLSDAGAPSYSSLLSGRRVFDAFAYVDSGAAEEDSSSASPAAGGPSAGAVAVHQRALLESEIQRRVSSGENVNLSTISGYGLSKLGPHARAVLAGDLDRKYGGQNGKSGHVSY